MERDDIPMTRLSPTVELVTIEMNFVTFGFPPQDIRLLFNHGDFHTFEF
jgi:hypothetical protein